MGASTKAWEAIHKALEDGVASAAADGNGAAARRLADSITQRTADPAPDEYILFDKMNDWALEIDRILSRVTCELSFRARGVA